MAILSIIISFPLIPIIIPRQNDIISPIKQNLCKHYSSSNNQIVKPMTINQSHLFNFQLVILQRYGENWEKSKLILETHAK